MDKRALRFLTILKNGKWHRKVGENTSVSTVLTCVHLMLVEEKLRPAGKMTGMPELPSRYLASYRITKRGRKALKTDRPTREEFIAAERCRTHKTFCECRGKPINKYFS